jgi:hypothetical protein
MRTLLLTILAAGVLWFPSGASAQASNYEPFRLDMAVLGTYAHGPTSFGFGGLVEPKFNVLNFLSVGARFEGAAMFGGSVDAYNESASVSIWAASAYLGKADFFLADWPVRPWVGLGAGLYYLAGQSFTDMGSSGNTTLHQKAGRYFGLAPQVGIELGGFRLSATYHAILGAEMEVEQTLGTGDVRSKGFTQNYVTFELGWRIFGRMRTPSNK